MFTSTVLVGLVALAQAHSAQTAGVLGSDDSEFARLLFQENYPDLAENLCRVITAKSTTGAPLEVVALGFDLGFYKARREQDLAGREAALRKVIEDQNAFLQTNARTRVAENVRANMPNVYVELAATLTAALERETDVEQRAERMGQAQQVFTEAKDSLTKRVNDFAARIDQGTGDPEYNLRQHMTAAFNLARMEYQNGMLFSAESPERKDMLKKALEAFREFGLNYGESLPYYDGIVYQGLCHEGLGKPDDAVVDYEDAIALRLQFDPDEKGVFQMGDEETNIVSGATRNLANLLIELKRGRQAIQVTEDYFKRTPDALLASSGPQILAAKAEAQILTGDIAGASATAQELVDLDQGGWSGQKGREILGRLPISGLAPDKILRIAETTAGRGDHARALDLCRQAREVVRGARDEADIGSASFFLAGRLYRTQSKLYEAAVAFDCAFELYPKGQSAPEALYVGVKVYRELAKKEKSRFYSARADARMQELATRYSGHARAAEAGIYQGERKEDDGDFEGARAFYLSVPKTSASYHDALFRLANATNLEAKARLQEDKREEAQALLAKAEGLYASAMQEIQAAAAEALDPAVQQKLTGLVVNCRLGLAQLYIDSARPEKVKESLEGLEKTITDPDVVAAIWGFRITALQMAGKVEEAVALFESVIQGGASGVESAAGVLARALDKSAQEEDAKRPGSPRSLELWRKATSYYLISLRGALRGTASLDPASVRIVAQRLYVIGLTFNKVPEGLFTFVDWQGEVIDPSLWVEAAQIYDRLDAQAPSMQVSIERARALAILGRIEEAEAIYARLFDQYSMFADEKSERFDRSVVESRPELVSAYLEWGVTSHRVGVAKKDEGLFARAETIYNRSVKNSTPDSRLWWQARYSQVLMLNDRGIYDVALDALENVKRTTDPKFDKGQFGFQGPFEALEAGLRKKVFR